MPSQSTEASVSIRMQARQHLAKLRQERLQRVAGRTSRRAAPDTVEDDVAETASTEDVSESLAGETPDTIAEAETLQQLDPVSVAPEAEQPLPMQDEEGDSPDAPDDAKMSEESVVAEDAETEPVAEALTDEGTDGSDDDGTDGSDDDGTDGSDNADIDAATDDNGQSPESDASEVDAAEYTQAETVEIDEGSDLFSLPGAGPGLVWMLQKSGVSDMATLAVADAEQLRVDLGLVAKMLDVDYWIEYAQNAQK